MSVEKSRSRPRRTSLESEEERAWVGFYQRVGRNPAIAGEVLAQLESDPEMKRNHLALYLCCKESLRQHKARQARNKRIAQFVRWLCIKLFLRPLHSLQKMCSQSSDLVVECLPEVGKNPATTQVHRLIRKSPFATAQTTFEQQTPSPGPDASPVSTETQTSAGVKTSRTAA